MKILILSDSHIGSIYGIAPRSKASNPYQNWIIEHWEQLVEECAGNIDYLVLNGDMVEGYAGKDNTTLWETDVDNQVEYAVQMLQPFLYKGNVKVLGTTGSGYHIGKGTGYDSDRQITEKLHGKHNKKLQIIHTPVGNIFIRHTSKNMNAEIKLIYEHSHEGLTRIDLLVGSHLHRALDYEKGSARVIHTPCMQYPTEFMGFGESVSFGALLIHVTQRSILPEKIIWKLPADIEQAMTGINSISIEEIQERENMEHERISKTFRIPKNTVIKIANELLKPKLEKHVSVKIERKNLKPK